MFIELTEIANHEKEGLIKRLIILNINHIIEYYETEHLIFPEAKCTLVCTEKRNIIVEESAKVIMKRSEIS